MDNENEMMENSSQSTSVESSEQVSESATQKTVEDTKQVEQSQSEPEMFTKERVIEMMKRRVNRSHNAFFNRYGVKDLSELDALFGKIKEYESMKNEYGEIQLRNADLIKNNALLKLNIDPSKYDDISVYFKGLEQNINEETLSEQLKNHPDWLKKTPVVGQVSSVGVDGHNVNQIDQKARIYKMFGVGNKGE